MIASHDTNSGQSQCESLDGAIECFKHVTLNQGGNSWLNWIVITMF